MTLAPDLPPGERIYAIGDVHGRYDLLIDLLHAIRRDNDARAEAEVRIILVGDLIDRGPDSAIVVEQCRALAARHDRFIVLKGNHEAIMVESLQGSFPAFTFWLQHGGDATLKSWDVPAGLVAEGPSRDLIAAAKAHVPSGTMKWLNDLPLIHQRGGCLFVHAGIRPGVPLARQAATDLMWIRDDFIDDTTPLPYFVVHGHSIEEAGPLLRSGRLGIDTGAYRTGRLTAAGFEGNDYWTFATGTSAVAESLPIDDNVAAVLAFRATTAGLPVRPRTMAHTLAIASLSCAALLALGSVQVLRDRGSAKATAPLAVAVVSPPRPVKALETATPMRIPAPSAAPVIEERRLAATVGPARRDTSVPTVPRRLPAAYESVVRDPRTVPGVARAARMDLARSSGDIATPRPPVGPPTAPVRVAAAPLPGSNDSAASGANVVQVLGRPPAVADEPTVIARPTASPGAAKARIDAIDAIKSLRRQ